jgi:hypothetical protein
VTAPVRAVCVDGPLAGRQITFPGDADTAEFHDPATGPVTYRLGDDFSSFPGGLRTAHVITSA